MERQELVTNKEYILAEMQLKLLNVLEDYMKQNNLKRNELADKLQVTKGYISQIMNVAYDHKLSKVVDLGLACDKIPMLFFVDINKFINEDKKDKEFELIPVSRPFEMTYYYDKSSLINEEDDKMVFSTDMYLNRNTSYLQMDSDKSSTEAVVININGNSDLRKIS